MGFFTFKFGYAYMRWRISNLTMTATRVTSGEKMTSENSNHGFLRDVKDNPAKRFALDVAGGAIFGALSIVLGIYTTPLIPRVAGWQIAFFDPVSLIWIASFMLFGFRAGFLTTIVGAFGLLPFDPTAWVGPMMKFGATVWLVLMPYLIARIKQKRSPRGEEVLAGRNFFFGSVIAWVIRLVVMTLLNYIILTTIFPYFDYMTLEWLGFPALSGWYAVVPTVVILNTVQSIGDSLIPYLIIVKGKLYEKTKIW